MASAHESGSVEINGFPIHYDKFGTGNHVVLLIPGALGKYIEYIAIDVA